MDEEPQPGPSHAEAGAATPNPPGPHRIIKMIQENGSIYHFEDTFVYTPLPGQYEDNDGGNQQTTKRFGTNTTGDKTEEISGDDTHNGEDSETSEEIEHDDRDRLIKK